MEAAADLSIEDLLDYKLVLEARCVARDQEILTLQLSLARLARIINQLNVTLAEKNAQLVTLKEPLLQATPGVVKLDEQE